MNQIGMPLLGVVLAALCMLVVGLGVVLRQVVARRRLQQMRAQYEAKKCARRQADGL